MVGGEKGESEGIGLNDEVGCLLLSIVGGGGEEGVEGTARPHTKELWGCTYSSTSMFTNIDTNTLKVFYSFDYLYKLIKKRWGKFICIYDGICPLRNTGSQHNYFNLFTDLTVVPFYFLQETS